MVLAISLALAGAADPLTDQAAQAAYDNGMVRFTAGNYTMAAAAFTKAATNAGMRQSASLALARVHLMRGNDNNAVTALNAAEPPETAPPLARAEWNLAMVELMESVGEYPDALLYATKANELAPLWAPTLLARGRVLETLGRNDEATAVYETMDKIIAAADYLTEADSLVALGEIIGRHATLKGIQASEQANNIFNNYLQLAYQDIDEKYWPAHIVAGNFALSKHRFDTAESEFNAALQHNRQLPDAYAGLAALQLQQWEFEECLKYVRLALATNPHHADALLVNAVCLLQWRKTDQALPVLEKILAKNPNNLQALSLAAAVNIRLGADELAEQYADRVREINPQCELLPLAIAEWLSAGRQFDKAEQYYQEAVDLAPHKSEPQTGLGELYMQTGQEDLARQAFKRAHDIDDFRADVVNYLNLLAEMEDYLVLTTPHFIVKVDGEYDAVLLGQVAAEAERIYEEVCADFQHFPLEKTVIEIFPTHPKFSVRLTGRGWLGTVGACTGRVIVLVAPNEGRSLFGTYNWATVLRHEYTHTVTLSATSNRIPHWFTEACAVWQQEDRQNFEAVGTLIAATREDRLFPVDELDWGFIRPRRGGDRGLAYAQAEWMMEYIIETYGFDKIGGLLAAFNDGKSQSEALGQVLSVTEAQFDSDFVTWARLQVEGWGFDARPMPAPAKIAKIAKGKPNDVGIQADYAVVLLRSGDVAQAQTVAEKALQLDERNAKALSVLAIVKLMAGEHVQATGYALRLEMVDPQNPTAARVLADCYLAQEQWSLAIMWLEQLKHRRPMDPRSYEQLTDIYTKLGQPGKALPNLVELHRRTMTDQEYARQIAEIYRSAGLEEQALYYYQQITNINPYESSTYEAMAAIHRNAGRHAAAVSAVRMLTLLQPNSADAWTKLAMVRFVGARQAGDRDGLLQAKTEAEKALQLDPEGQAGRVLKRITDELAGLQDDPQPPAEPTPAEQPEAGEPEQDQEQPTP